MAKQSKTETRAVGRNVRVTVEGDVLTLVVDLSKRLGPSKSEKNVLVATTGGNVFVAEGSEVKLGLNCYVPLENAGS